MGAVEVATWWGQEAIARAEERCSDYRGTTILKGCGHWLQQERSAETNAVLEQFLRGLTYRPKNPL